MKLEEESCSMMIMMPMRIREGIAKGSWWMKRLIILYQIDKNKNNKTQRMKRMQLFLLSCLPCPELSVMTKSRTTMKTWRWNQLMLMIQQHPLIEERRYRRLRIRFHCSNYKLYLSTPPATITRPPRPLQDLPSTCIPWRSWFILLHTRMTTIIQEENKTDFSF